MQVADVAQRVLVLSVDGQHPLVVDSRLVRPLLLVMQVAEVAQPVHVLSVDGERLAVVVSRLHHVLIAAGPC
jgi:hypothetical protein